MNRSHTCKNKATVCLNPRRGHFDRDLSLLKGKGRGLRVEPKGISPRYDAGQGVGTIGTSKGGGRGRGGIGLGGKLESEATE